MVTKPNKLSFTSGGLFLKESLELLEIFKETGDWITAREAAVSRNIIQTKTTSSVTRIVREIAFRLQTLNNTELKLLATGNEQNQKHLLWLAICRKYSLIADFAREVLHERYVSLKPDLALDDFDTFYNKKAVWDEALDEIKESTRKKLRQVLFRMLREAGFLSEEKLIIPAFLSPGLITLLSTNKNNEIMYFPIFESDMKASLK